MSDMEEDDGLSLLHTEEDDDDDMLPVPKRQRVDKISNLNQAKGMKVRGTKDCQCI